MKPFSYLLVPVLVGSSLAFGPTLQAEETPAPAAKPAAAAPAAPAEESQETIYGYELMTPEERVEHMNLIKTAKSEEERQKLREDHHKLMQERAVEKGVTLPDMPGPGPGAGKGPGQGMGPGGNK